MTLNIIIRDHSWNMLEIITLFYPYINIYNNKYYLFTAAAIANSYSEKKKDMDNFGLIFISVNSVKTQ